MGLLDEILGGAIGGGPGARPGARGGQASPAGGNMGAVVAALLPVVLSMLANRQGGQAAGPAGGGGLGDLLGGLLGGQAGGGAGMGGLGALVEQFQRAGYGEQANSWVGRGQNLPISPDAIGQVLGGGALAEIARRAGISEDEASAGLSQMLPEVVDRVTPEGRVPDLDQLGASVDALTRQFRG